MLKKEKGIFYLVVGICVAILIILTIVGILLPKQPYSKGAAVFFLNEQPHQFQSGFGMDGACFTGILSGGRRSRWDYLVSGSSDVGGRGKPNAPWSLLTPEDAPDKSEIWVSSDTNVATVDGMGRITGVGGRQLHCHRHQRCQSSSVCHCSGDSFRRHGCHYGDHYAQPAGSHHSCTCPHTCAYAGTYTEPHSFSVGTLSVSGAAAFSAGGAGTLSIGIISAAGLSCSPNGSVFRRVIILVDGVFVLGIEVKCLNWQKKLLCIAVVSVLVLFMVGAVWFVSWQQSQPQPPASSSSSASRAVSRTASSQLEAGKPNFLCTGSFLSDFAAGCFGFCCLFVGSDGCRRSSLLPISWNWRWGRVRCPIVTMLPENASNKWGNLEYFQSFGG